METKRNNKQVVKNGGRTRKTGRLVISARVPHAVPVFLAAAPLPLLRIARVSGQERWYVGVGCSVVNANPMINDEYGADLLA
jgi:hypothetical protein